MYRHAVFTLVLSYLTSYLLQLEALSIVSLIHRKPLIEINQEAADHQSNDSEHYITQRLDNFDHQNPRTFQMRYFKYDEYFKTGGPIFIFIGGWWDISANKDNTAGTLVNDMAKESNGLLIYTEHRFYGKSIPTNSFSVEDLKYLTIEQSLADLAHFVREITSDKQLNATGGVIVVGSSYSAIMAVWFRQKYPHLVNGAWASSPPLQAKLDCFEYTETVGESIRTVSSDKCYNDIEETFKAIDNLFANNDKDSLLNLFNVCDDFDMENKLDVWNFVSSAKDIFSAFVLFFQVDMIKYSCTTLANEDSNETNDMNYLKNFAKIFEQVYDSDGKCLNLKYENSVKQLKQQKSYFVLYYQMCSEFGWHPTTNSKNQPFGSNVPVELYLNFCHDVFGDVFNNSTFESNINHTNDLYGGFNPGVTNVYFSYGSLDPWLRMGVLSDLNEHSPSAVIEGYSHCQDLGSINFTEDSPELIKSKVNVLNLVKKWLKY